MFIVEACSTEKVESWARHELRIMVHAKIGRSFKTILTSSSCWVVQLSDGWKGGVWIALFRNLRVWVGGVVCVGSLVGFGVVVDGLLVMLATAFVAVLFLLLPFNVAATNTLRMVVRGAAVGILLR